VPNTRENVQQVISDPVVDISVNMTASMFGLPKETVTKILCIGLPIMAQLAETNPELLKRIYAATLATMPGPVQDFYRRMVANPVVRQAVMDDYKASFGSMLDAVNREAGKQAGTTDGQAREVFAATLPAISLCLGQANAGGDQQTFAAHLRTFFS
jgi:hypothetical protein